MVRHPKPPFLPFSQRVGQRRRDRFTCSQFVCGGTHSEHNPSPPFHLGEGLHKYGNGKVSRKALSSKSMEFVVINPCYFANKSIYAYMYIIT
jgi:hypothetical protein